MALTDHEARLEHEGERILDFWDSPAATALSKVARSGPCADMQSCMKRRSGRSLRPCAGDAAHQSHELFMKVVEPGRRKVCSATSQRGGRSRNRNWRSWEVAGEVSTVKIDGSGWSKLTVPIALKRARS